jgi:hypothetical protein
MGFEPTRGDPNGLAVHRLNRSATMSSTLLCLNPSVDLDDCTIHIPEGSFPAQPRVRSFFVRVFNGVRRH